MIVNAAIDGHTLFCTQQGVCGIAWGPAGIAAVQLPELPITLKGSLTTQAQIVAGAHATRERMLREMRRRCSAARSSGVVAAVDCNNSGHGAMGSSCACALQAAAMHFVVPGCVDTHSTACSVCAAWAAFTACTEGGARGRCALAALTLTDAPRSGAVSTECPPPAVVQHAIAGIQALLAGVRRNLQEVALDMSCISAFQQRVYAMTRAIAPGHTRTYGDMARELGSPNLARAVGQALGHNPFAPVVPCHRVLAAGGKPGGFSAGEGASTKMHMLAMEGAVQGESLPLF